MTKYEKVEKGGVSGSGRTRAPIPTGRRNNFPAPTVAPVLPNMPGGQENLMQTIHLPGGLRVTTPQFQSSGFEGDIDTVKLFIQNVEVDSVELTVDANFNAPPYMFTVAREKLVDGVNSIHFTSFSFNLGESERIRVTIDTLDPALNNPPAVLVLPDNLTGPLTHEYLEEHGGLTLTLPAYADPKPGDHGRLYWNRTDTHVMTFNLDGGMAAQEIQVPAALIRNAGEGLQDIKYEVIDRAGNISQFSRSLYLPVVLNPGPEDLEAPIVRDTIDLAEARLGVPVLFNEYTNWLSGDEVRLLLNRVQFDAVTLGANPAWPLMFTATYPALARPGDQYTGDFSALVVRGGTTMSPVTQSAVDLRVPGPVNPEEPSPVNPELDVPVLTSFTGNANQLTGADANQPASVAFALYDPAVADEVIRLYYGPGQGVAATHTLTTESPGDIITMALPWPIIQAVGNGLEIELYYRIFATADSENFQQSGSQLVRSEVIQLADLRLAEIVGVTGNNVVCSDQPWNGLNVLVVDRDHLEAGDNVVLHFSMINLGDTDPVEGTEVDLAANVSDPNQGVNIPLLWDYIRPAGNRARMLLAWSVFRGGIAVGRSEVKQYNYNVSVGTGNCIPGGGTAGQRVARLG